MTFFIFALLSVCMMWQHIRIIRLQVRVDTVTAQAAYLSDKVSLLLLQPDKPQQSRPPLAGVTYSGRPCA